MKQAILGKKIGMTQLFREDGTMIPVTVVLAGPCPVTQVKTVEHDGYDAVQMAFQPVREKLIAAFSAKRAFDCIVVTVFCHSD